VPRRIFASLILRVTGNVNADAGIGIRIPLKKIITWRQEVKPFVSARCIRRCIRERLYEKGFNIDPLQLIGEKKEVLSDVGDPVTYIDDDVFGFFKPQEPPIRRSSPIKISHLISLRHAEVKVEFAARFSRDFLLEYAKGYPGLFEVELADWLGKLDVIISDRIGRFNEDELSGEVKEKFKEILKEYYDQKTKQYVLSSEERFKRLRAFLEILLWEGWIFPRGSQGPSTSEYHYAVITLTKHFVPIFGYIDIADDGKLNEDLIVKFKEMYSGFIDKLIVINYKDASYTRYERENVSSNLNLNWGEMNKIINELCCYIVPEHKECREEKLG